MQKPSAFHEGALGNGGLAPFVFTSAVGRNECTFSRTGRFSFKKNNYSAYFSEGGRCGLQEEFISSPLEMK
jgi:hypothetical protein